MTKLEEKMLVSHNNLVGHIVHLGEKYFTLKPVGSNALVLVFKEYWKSVTVLEVAQTP